MNAPLAKASGVAPGIQPLTLLFMAAWLLRLVVLVAIAPYHAAATSTVWDFGHEAACLGDSIFRGQGFGDPWAHGTGPSGWLTPPYPALIAALMWIFDGLNPAMAFTLFALQALAGAASCVLLVRLGKNLGAPAAGWWGGVLFALYPPGIWNAVNVVWDTTFVSFGTLACLVLLTRAGALSTTRSVIALGLAWGSLAFLNPAPLALLPAVFLFIALSEGTRAARARNAAIFTLSLLAVCAPWMLRNARVLGTPNLRPNFGVELRLGNNPEANGHPVPFKFHPSHVPEELALYRELGEKAYAANCQQRALEWIAAEPARFASLCLRRIVYFWVGDSPLTDERTSRSVGARLDPNAWAKFLSFAALGILGWIGALRWRGPARDRALLLAALAGFGLAYYVTHVSERYRFPIDPLLALLCAAAVLEWCGRARARMPQP